jgi:outer membrane lipoprotein-sorting protein
MMKIFQNIVVGVLLAFSLALVPQTVAAKVPPLPLTTDQQAAVKRINDYFNSFQTMKCNFTQVSARGTLTNGVLYISKPGKLRFDYAPPNPLLIVADGRWLTIKDRQRERGDQFPLGATPLRLVVSPQLDLLAETDIIAFDSHDGLTTVSLQDRKDSMGGYITLIFDEKLNQLQQWVVVDSKDRRTTVQLSNMEYGGKFDPKLFIGEINREKNK